jgi:outer membrane protein OmpA-like peptidoglycan-associated protein
LFSLVLLVSASAAWSADAERVNLGSAVPKAKDVEQGLFPDDACEELKANGFKCMGFKPAVRFVMPSSSFQVGSAELPEGLKRQLDVFAQVLGKKKGAAHAVRVEGHADTSGTPEANQALSQARADAAREYLMSKGVAPDLLVAVGLGSTELADPDQPLSAKNRRVEIGRAQAPVSP